jgi:hypothetical protein
LNIPAKRSASSGDSGPPGASAPLSFGPDELSAVIFPRRRERPRSGRSQAYHP